MCCASAPVVQRNTHQHTNMHWDFTTNNAIFTLLVRFIIILFKSIGYTNTMQVNTRKQEQRAQTANDFKHISIPNVLF